MNRDAVWLVKEELKRSKLTIAATVLFYLLYGWIAAILTINTPMEGLEGDASAFALDVLFLSLMSVVCFGFSKGYFTNYWKTDYFTVKLAVMRSLPIPPRTLASYRLLKAVVYAAVIALSYFGAFYSASSWAQTSFTPVQILAFAVCWLSYGFAVSMLFVWLEWGVSGKTYFGSGLILIFVIVALDIAANFGFDIHLTLLLSQWVTSPYGPVVTLCFMTAGAVAILLGYKRLVNILTARDYR